MQGHGKCLVDSMSSFTVNGPLHRVLISEDFWYQNSYEIAQYLTTKFMDYCSKVYKVMDTDDLTSREERKNEYDLKIKGQEKLCMLSFSPDETVKGARYYCACSVCICGECDTCIGKISHQADDDDGSKDKDDNDSDDDEEGGDDNDRDGTLDKEGDKSVGREEYELQRNALMGILAHTSLYILQIILNYSIFVKSALLRILKMIMGIYSKVVKTI